jgi:hypothetical protein
VAPPLPPIADSAADERTHGEHRDLLRQTIVEPIADAAPVQARVPKGRDLEVVSDRPDDQVELCRPAYRPAMPRLWILDDGRETGELVRMRKATLVIGRNVGDVQIPHDEGISDPHLEIVHRGSRCLLRDLGSATGTFVRIRQSTVECGQEVRIGSKRYRIGALGPLVCLEGEGRVWEWELQGMEVTLGRAPGCWPLAGSDDPSVSPWHARLWHDESDRWQLADGNSLNGTWLRAPEMEVEHVAEFLLGEQRFRLEVS